MATLHVRNVPDDLYERIRHRAAIERRSLSAEVVTILEQVVGQRPEARLVLDRIVRRRRQLKRTAGQFPSSVELLREDRSR